MSFKDLRYSLRILLKNPGTSLAAILALALGIGLTTAMFTLIYALILKPLPFEDGERLIHLESSNLAQGISSQEATQHDFEDWRRRQTSFEDLAAFEIININLSDGQRPERFQGAAISPNFLELLRVRPTLGRGFAARDAEEGAPKVALLSDKVWHTRYGSDPKIVGSSVRVDGRPTEVVGVLPPGFSFPLSQEIWLPLHLQTSTLQRGEGTTLEVFGLLKEGVSLSEARAEMSSIATSLAAQYPQSNEGVGSVIKPYKKEFTDDQTMALVWTMFGAVILVLLIACANVANLLLARASGRTKELAIRSALGASRKKAIFQLLADSVWIAFFGGILGLAVAQWCIGWLNGVISQMTTPFWLMLGLDARILGFVALVALISAVLAGLLPAIQATRTGLSEILADANRGSSSRHMGRLSRILVIAEIAFSCGLLIAAGLTIRTVVTLSDLDFGFAPQEVLTARIALSDETYSQDEQRLSFYRSLEAGLRRRSEVSQFGFVTSLPTHWAYQSSVEIEGEAYTDEKRHPRIRFFVADPGYFETFNVRPLNGRLLQASDRQDTLPVTVITESMARRFWPGQTPLGQRIRLPEGEESPWRTVVGVVPDPFMNAMNQGDSSAAFLPLLQNLRQNISIAVTGTTGLEGLSAALRQEMATVDPDEPIFFVESMRDVVQKTTFQYQILGTMFSAFAAAALLLAAVGLYGVMAFAVGQRTQEIGVRMAFGARREQVLGMVIRNGLLQAAIGVGFGLILALFLGQALKSALYNVSSTDPFSFLVPPLALTCIAFLACLLPARRAAALDPVKALRQS